MLSCSSGSRLATTSRCPARPARRLRLSRAFGRPSVDPLAQQRPATYRTGEVYTVSSPTELDKFLADYSDKLVVLMAKASHCKPCQRFGPTYQRLAMLVDAVCLEIMGDESPENKKYMVETGVKVTPTFRMFRNGQLVDTVTGAKIPKVLPVIVGQLKDGERGKFLTPEDVEPPSDSDDE